MYDIQEEIDKALEHEDKEKAKKLQEELEAIMNNQMYGLRTAMDKTLKEIQEGVLDDGEEQVQRTRTVENV